MTWDSDSIKEPHTQEETQGTTTTPVPTQEEPLAVLMLPTWLPCRYIRELQQKSLPISRRRRAQ
jgi:hypothetical protein